MAAAPATRIPSPRAPAVLAAALLAAPFALAFFTGGYFTQARLVAAVGIWLLVAAAALAGRERLHLGPPAVAVLAALAALSAWTALSSTWAPLSAPAVDALERVLLYLGACAAGVLLLGDRRRARWMEPAVAGGALVVVGYGLAGRMLPELVELDRTASAGGRLDQPLTYWNAQGALAALGLIVAIRLAGEDTRAVRLRAAAAAAAVPLGLGVYLTFSRGAASALIVGLAVLLALAPSWPQLRAGAIALEAAAAAVIAAALLPAVRAGEGAGAEGQGLILLAVTAAAMAVAAFAQARTAAAEHDGAVAGGVLPGGRLLPRAACIVAVLLALAPFAAASLVREDGGDDPAFGATNARLGSLGSDRYGYWQVALDAWADDPVIGTGAGGFRVAWLRERDSPDPLRDAHSVELEHLSQLGLVGLGLLLAAFGAVAVAARRAAHADAALAAGPAAALAVWAAHSAIDWDWQMPALTLVAAVLAGGLLGRAEAGPQLAE